MRNNHASFSRAASLYPDTHLSFLYVLFFFSGCAALIYQIMWQRMLFTLFGVDLQSITIIVSVFMFGLGMGGLAGGYLADKWSRHLLTLYILIELSVALFGRYSPWLIHASGNHFFSHHALITVLASFIILSVPTLLMGATFPILVTHVNQLHHHVGRSVGGLYFANTLGGAMGAYLSGFVLLNFIDIGEAVNVAVFLNLAIAIMAFIVFRERQR
jgi:predicted membrane-bound spermidine synthase